MRLFRTIIILLFIVGFPALSWYYLSTGADWRRAGWEEMSARIPVNFPEFIATGGETLNIDDMPGTYLITVDLDNYQSGDELDKLAAQFGAREDVLFVAFTNRNKTLPGSEVWQVIDCQKNPCGSVRSLLFEGGTNAALVDSAKQIRRRYDLEDVEDLKKLVEHGAILFPTEKRKKIELIRNRK